MNYGAKQTESEIRTRRSIARLLSLADMVERSSMQFILIRVFLLWLLRSTEWRVRSHVFEIAGEAGLTELPEIFDVFDAADNGYLEQNSPDEALDMALRLRALAWLYGVNITTRRIGDDYYWANYWRHMRWLATAAQINALMQINAQKPGHQTLVRPEVRPGSRPCPALTSLFQAENGGRPAIWQRNEEATVRQRRPTDPLNPGVAADLSFLGRGPWSLPHAHMPDFAQLPFEINGFLTRRGATIC